MPRDREIDEEVDPLETRTPEEIAADAEKRKQEMANPEMLNGILSEADESNDLNTILDDAAAEPEEEDFFEAQSAGHADANYAGINGGEAQREGETEWNYNMRTYNSGFKPDAYDPTSLMNINDSPVTKALRIAQDSRIGNVADVTYDPFSLKSINDSPANKAISSYAASRSDRSKAAGPKGSPPPQSTRRDMRYQFFPDSASGQDPSAANEPLVKPLHKPLFAKKRTTPVFPK